MNARTLPVIPLPVLATSLSKAPLLFGFLLVLTAVLLTWHHYGMERVITLSPSAPYTYHSATDKNDGGASTVALRRVGDALQMDCQLVKQVDWPYCKVRFEVGTAASGLDLSQFQSVSVDADHAGPGLHRARLVLINFEDGWSKPDDWLTHKFNEVEAFEFTPGQLLELPLNVFNTAVWWRIRAKPPITRAGMRIDHVTTVELVTAADSELGRHVITLRAIHFHGKLLTKNTLLSILIGIWITSATGWAALLWFTMRRELNTSKAELSLLNEVNRALRLETEALAGQAHHDPLTGVLNRQGLRAELMAVGGRVTEPVSVVFVDIDHFKRVNDGYGHDAGDQVLCQFALAISSNLRSSDRLVRWGGEEFLLVCPSSDVHQAAALAEKLRTVLTEQPWHNDLAVTASFGVAQRLDGEGIGDAITRADHALYRAKQTGRNRVQADFGHDTPLSTGTADKTVCSKEEVLECN